MSINTLLDNPESQSKPWCNLYVDSLTTYKNLNILGDVSMPSQYEELNIEVDIKYNGVSLLGGGPLHPASLVRNGKMVTLWVDGFQVDPLPNDGNHSIIIEPVPALDSKWCIHQTGYFFGVTSTAETLSKTGRILVGFDGNVSVYPDNFIAVGNSSNYTFTGNERGGFRDICVTYISN